MNKSPQTWRCTKCESNFTQKSSLSRHSKRCLADIPSISRRKACYECSSSKTRCDLRRPHCGRCKSKEVECSYAYPPSPIASDSTVPDGLGHEDPITGARNGLSSPMTEDGATPSLSRLWGDEGRTVTGVEPSSAFLTVNNPPLIFVWRVLRTYPYIFTSGQPPPFIHWSQMEDPMRPPLLTCCGILSRPGTVGLEDDAAGAVASLLKVHQNQDEETLLASVQACLLYTIVLLFPNSKISRTHRADQDLIMALQSMTFELQKTGLVMKAETNSVLPSWSEWRRMAAKRRTIQASHVLMWAWSALHGYPPFQCREVAFVPSPAPKVLWQARGDEWRMLYSKWLERWKNGPHRLEELMTTAPKIELDDRTQRWLEEADEFGLLLMSQVNTID